MTPDSENVSFCRRDRPPVPNALAAMGWTAFLLLITLLLGACSEEVPGMASIETDAHGYLCEQCGGKFYTGKKVFLEGKCPKCSQDSLADVTGYWCEKDKHLTIRPRTQGPAGAAVCEKCGASVKTAMVSPKEKDLVAWGAQKTAAPSR